MSGVGELEGVVKNVGSVVDAVAKNINKEENGDGFTSLLKKDEVTFPDPYLPCKRPFKKFIDIFNFVFQQFRKLLPLKTLTTTWKVALLRQNQEFHHPNQQKLITCKEHPLMVGQL